MKHIPLHPLCIAIFPALSLYLVNIYRFPIPLVELTRPIIGSIILVVIIWLLLSIKIRPIALNAALTSVVALVFFSFGHIYEASIFKYGNTLAIILIFSIFIVYSSLFNALILKYKRNINSITKILNLVGIVLLFVVIFQIAYIFYLRSKSQPYTFDVPAKTSVTSPLRDIYYIILDGYGRDDVLQSLYKFDNYSFLQELQGRGFKIISGAHSNYNQTQLSLASSLNLSYLQGFSDTIGENVLNWNALSANINDNAVFRIAKSAGYKTVAVASGFPWTELPGADIYLKPSHILTEFEGMFINTTLLPHLLRWFNLPTEVDQYRLALLSRLEIFPEIAQSDQPTISFLHIISPHPPFVFNENGLVVNEDNLLRHGDGSVWVRNEEERAAYRQAYIKQLKFINSKVLKMVDDIISGSEVAPIIILQGDHGPGSSFNNFSLKQSNLDERFSIFSAMLLPEIPEGFVPNDINPVNTFRLIFNYYLNTNLALEQNFSYYSTLSERYKFIDITDQLSECAYRENGERIND